ncbi:Uncharacterized protein OBRU01_21952 [Operophtera brumata]|uniref:Endonuclease/exonuclease/phosphatase domain-containing protein n=1 Tax=Operophtera brumata TaxID=104452 RepID=A0A0L7KQK6_OPEBR|nr:Uncharacterized protein OBRU01_21952 [Operophtera brumata]
MMRHPVEIMAINETWLREGGEARAPVLPGYRLRHAPRDSAGSGGGRDRGGGVGFYLKRGVNARLIAHPQAPIDQMWLSLTLNGLKLAIGTAYRPPWQNVDTFLDALTESVTSLHAFDYIVLTGDFNIDLLELNAPKTKKLLDFLKCAGLDQYVTVPTHFTDHSETLIDLLCSNIKITDIDVDHIPDLSRHSLISCKLRIKKDKPVPKWIVYRPIKDIDSEKFNHDLNDINWNSEGDGVPVTAAYGGVSLREDLHPRDLSQRYLPDQAPRGSLAEDEATAVELHTKRLFKYTIVL